MQCESHSNKHNDVSGNIEGSQLQTAKAHYNALYAVMRICVCATFLPPDYYL